MVNLIYLQRRYDFELSYEIIAMIILHIIMTACKRLTILKALLHRRSGFIKVIHILMKQHTEIIHQTQSLCFFKIVLNSLRRE